MLTPNDHNMLPVVAIVGRPNVGKSTLFNRITRTRAALVADEPGMTRDRHYAEATVNDKRFILIDTGGIGEETEDIDAYTKTQSYRAIDEAQYVLFVVDAKTGLIPADIHIAHDLRSKHKPIFLVVNKADGVNEEEALNDFYQLGFSEVYAISAEHNRGVTDLLEDVTRDFSVIDSHEKRDDGIKFAIIGRPNVGKSTLTNRMLGEERMIVFDQPGTTRDSIYTRFERQGQRYTVIDTAGVRRRSKVHETPEKFSIVKTLQAISASNVVIVLFDATAEIAAQDLSLSGYALDAGKAMVIAINKWDNLEDTQKEFIKKELNRRLSFLDFAPLHFISALHGTGVGELFHSIDQAYASAMCDIKTHDLTALLEQALAEHSPPMVHGRRIKLRYAHAGGKNPPIIVIHGNQLERLPGSYQRYLVNYFRKALHLVGTPLQLQLKTSKNPFEHRYNKLTPLQEYKLKKENQRNRPKNNKTGAR